MQAITDRLGIDIGDRLAKNSVKRKFLIYEVPDENVFPPFEDFEVKHDYLVSSSGGTKARLRKRGQKGNIALVLGWLGAGAVHYLKLCIVEV